MRNSLSLITFWRRNLTKLLPFVFIVLFSVFAIIVSSALFSSSFDTTEFYTNCERTTAFISFPADAPDPAEILKNYPSISGTYEIELQWTRDVKVLGIFPMSFPVLGVKKADLEDLMEYYQVRLKEGRLFNEGAKEIIVPEQIVRSRKTKLGEKINPYVTKEKIKEVEEKIEGESPEERNRLVKWLRWAKLRTYEIVGILEGKSAVEFYPGEHFIFGRPEGKFRRRLATFSEPMKHQYKQQDELIRKASNECIGKLNRSSEGWKWWTWKESYQTPIERIRKNMGFISGVALIVSVVIFSLVTIFLSLIHLEERIPEWGLFLAVGLTKFQLMKRVFSENSGLVLISWLGGMALSRVVLGILSAKIFIPRGWFLCTSPADIIPWTIPIPVGMLVCALVIAFYRLRRLDPVETIEKRW